jgi:hypothetical protein
MIYETDTDMLAIWNGSAWRYIAATTPTNGTVLQVQQTISTTTYTTNSNFPQLSPINCSITPKSSSSKILVEANISAYIGAGGANNNRIGLYGVSYGASSTTALYRYRVGGQVNVGSDLFSSANIKFLHSPSTTSACVYNILYGRYSGFDNPVLISGEASGANSITTLTLTEIAG